MQRKSSTPRRERVAPGIYSQDGNLYAGFNEPETKRWRFKKLAAKSLRDAKRERDAHLAALREGPRCDRVETIFDTCLDTLEASGAREKTVRHNRWIAKRYLRDELGSKRAQKITTTDVRKLLRSLSHLSGWTQVKVVQVMREGFAVAIREHVIVRSPLEKLDPRELPKPGSTKKPRRLDAAELDLLLVAAKTKTPGYYALFALLAFTGVRVREALGLTWKDVDLDQGVLRVERQLGDDDCRHLDVKTENAERELPLYPRLRRVLAEHKLASPWNHDDDPVFAACRRKAKGYRNVLRALAEAVKEAKIDVAPDERLSPHPSRRRRSKDGRRAPERASDESIPTDPPGDSPAPVFGNVL